ncbi:hypothetical protein BDZ89DRAFT_1062839 [Hymenopellis radicata]|nr:hypothetical protein BDZ89DRAFT_1062839 [Hymenopellis radicata]
MDFQDKSDDEDNMWAVIEITGETTLKYKVRSNLFSGSPLNHDSYALHFFVLRCLPLAFIQACQLTGLHQVRWAGLDPATGKPWPQDWVPKKDVTSDLVDAWRAKGIKAKGRRHSSSPAWTGTVQPPKRRRSAMKEEMEEDEEDRNDSVISVRKGSWKDGSRVNKPLSSSSKTTPHSASSSLPSDAKAKRLHSRSPATTKTNSAVSKSPQATSRASTSSSSTLQRKRKRPSTRSSEDELDLLSKRRKVDTSNISLNAISLAQGDSMPETSRRFPELEQRTPDPLFLQSDSPEPERELGVWREPESSKTAAPVATDSGVESPKDTLPGPFISRSEMVRAMTEGLNAAGMHVVLGLDSGQNVHKSLEDNLHSQETRRLNDQAVHDRAPDTKTCSSATSGLRNDEDLEALEGSTGTEKAQADNAVVDGSVAPVGGGMLADNEAPDSSKVPFLELQDVDTDDDQSYLIRFDSAKNDHIPTSLPQARRATSIDTSGRTAEGQPDNMYTRLDDGSREHLHPHLSANEARNRKEEASTTDLEQTRVGAEHVERSHEVIEENERDKILDMELQYPDDDELDDVHDDPASPTAEQTIHDLQRQLSDKCAELAQKDVQISLLQRLSCANTTTTPPNGSSASSNTVLQPSGLTTFLEQRIAWLEDDAKRWRQAAQFIIRKDELNSDSDKRELDRVKGELSEMRARAEEAERLLASMRSEEERRLAFSASAG